VIWRLHIILIYLGPSPYWCTKITGSLCVILMSVRIQQHYCERAGCESRNLNGPRSHGICCNGFRCYGQHNSNCRFRSDTRRGQSDGKHGRDTSNCNRHRRTFVKQRLKSHRSASGGRGQASQSRGGQQAKARPPGQCTRSGQQAKAQPSRQCTRSGQQAKAQPPGPPLPPPFHHAKTSERF
jgi:hypothetical protein